jgi:hypothetical protein
VRVAGAPFAISFPRSQPIAGRLERIIPTAADLLLLTPRYFSPVLLKRSCGPAFECGYSRPLHWVTAHRAFLCGASFPQVGHALVTILCGGQVFTRHRCSLSGSTFPQPHFDLWYSIRGEASHCFFGVPTFPSRRPNPIRATAMVGACM